MRLARRHIGHRGAIAVKTHRAQLCRDQRAQLIGRLDIVSEEDEAPWIGLAEERSFRWREAGPLAAKDRGGGYQRSLSGTQAAFSDRSAAQKRRASASSLKPAARSR